MAATATAIPQQDPVIKIEHDRELSAYIVWVYGAFHEGDGDTFEYAGEADRKVQRQDAINRADTIRRECEAGTGLEFDIITNF